MSNYITITIIFEYIFLFSFVWAYRGEYRNALQTIPFRSDVGKKSEMWAHQWIKVLRISEIRFLTQKLKK